MSVITTMSSANFIITIFFPFIIFPTLISSLTLFIAFYTYRLSRDGDTAHPCLTPFLIFASSWLSPYHITPISYSYKLLIVLLSLYYVILALFKILNIVFHFTLSKAFSISTKVIEVVFHFLFGFSIYFLVPNYHP